jgi:hypothetical protein
MDVESIKGASGKYKWHFYPFEQQTIIKYSALADIRELGFWKMILDQRPDLSKSLNISVSQIVLRAIQSEAEKN